MEAFRQVQMNILSELDRLCRENDIPYILTGHTARSALQHGALPQTEAVPTVGMLYKDALRLKKLLKNSNVCTESAISNRRIARMLMRCSNTDTTCIRIDELNSFKQPGICVYIELIRPVPKNRIVNKLFKLLDAEAALSSEMRRLGGIWRAIFALLVLPEKLFLCMAYRGRPFGGNENIRIARFPQKSVEFPLQMLTKRQQLRVDGVDLFVPQDSENYLEKEFGHFSRPDDLERFANDMAMTVIDVETPCARSLELVKDLYGKVAHVNWVRRYILRGRMRFLRKKIEKYWDLLFLTRDRFALWKQFMPQKEYICTLYNNKDEEGLSIVLAPYMAALKYHLSKNLALCFDKELFEAALFLLEYEGRTNDVLRLKDLVFPEHFKPISIEGFKND